MTQKWNKEVVLNKSNNKILNIYILLPSLILQQLFKALTFYKLGEIVEDIYLIS